MYDAQNLIKLAEEFECLAASNVTKSQYAYHIKSPDFKGKCIYPLSVLEEKFPAIYKNEIKKYKGRESHPDIKIDILDAKWRDCISLSTLNPIKIFQLERLLGIRGHEDVSSIDVFQFKIKDLKDFNMCLYDDNKSPKKSEAYKKIDIKSYKETEFVPIETIKYFIKSKEENEYPLLFGNIIHLLVKGIMPIDKAKIISIND